MIYKQRKMKLKLYSVQQHVAFEYAIVINVSKVKKINILFPLVAFTKYM